jgi:hypothetical protein
MQLEPTANFVNIHDHLPGKDGGGPSETASNQGPGLNFLEINKAVVILSCCP